jgi:hypothetical protein
MRARTRSCSSDGNQTRRLPEQLREINAYIEILVAIVYALQRSRTKGPITALKRRVPIPWRFPHQIVPFY